MRPKLWQTWFLFTSALVLLALGANHWAQNRDFRAGLLGHANALERERLPRLAQRFAEAYRREGGWAAVVERPRLFHRLLAPLEAVDPGPMPGEFEAGPGRRTQRGPGPGPGGGPPGPGPREGFAPPPADARAFPQRVSLLDAEGRLLRGAEPESAAAREPILVDGRVIGQLSLNPMPRLQSPLEIEFARRQGLHALAIAAGVLLLSLLSALLLARWLGRRLGRLADASQRLAAGDFSVRIGDPGHDELGALGRDFDRMAAALAENRAARDRWIADISHELRTPLTVLRGELAALQDGIRPLDAAAVDSLAAEAERLSARVDDLYALALSDQGSLSYRFTAVDFAALLQACCQRHRAGFAEAGLELQLPPLPPCPLAQADPARLEQLLDNLLQNSRRYTDRGGRVELALTPARAGWIELRVDDSAPAPAPAELARLGERHFRAGASARAPAGGGLGLSICANIAHAHGGHLRFEPSPLGGLRVRLDLPQRGIGT
jgi:two-component system, OmpR family, sensor histidine kinase BaeS